MWQNLKINVADIPNPWLRLKPTSLTLLASSWHDVCIVLLPSQTCTSKGLSILKRSGSIATSTHIFLSGDAGYHHIWAPREKLNELPEAEL